MYFLFGNVFKLVPFCPSAPFLLDAALLCHPRTLFSLLSCSALSRTSADTGHDLTICTWKAVFLRLRRDSLFCRFLFRNQKFPLLRSGNSAFAPTAQIDSFFKASPASGAALKDKGLKLKSEHRTNITVSAVLTGEVQLAGSKPCIPRVVA